MQKKKGISLIVLIITIIVMLILAGTVIISLSNDGIIDKAKDAVDKTNEKQLQELANLAWAEAYANNMGKTRDELIPILKTEVEKTLSKNNLDIEDYAIEVTEKGVTVTKGWVQTADGKIIKGSTVLEIGDYINYDETNGGTITGITNVEWQVLGVENNELLVISSKNVGYMRLGAINYVPVSEQPLVTDLKIQKVSTNSNELLNISSTDIQYHTLNYIEDAKNDYINAIPWLNEASLSYGKGIYATKARSVTVEDIDKITGYDKTTYGKGTMEEYGNVVTFLYNKTTYPTYRCSNGVTGTLTESHNKNGFCWYDLNKGWQEVSSTDLTSTNNNGKEIAKLTMTGYSYDVDKVTDLKIKSNKAYNMLFGSNDELRYWLASLHVGSWNNNGYGSVSFGLKEVYNGSISYYRICDSTGYIDEKSLGVRPVVYLSADFKINK